MKLHTDIIILKTRTRFNTEPGHPITSLFVNEIIETLPKRSKSKADTVPSSTSYIKTGDSGGIWPSSGTGWLRIFLDSSLWDILIHRWKIDHSALNSRLSLSISMNIEYRFQLDGGMCAMTLRTDMRLIF